MINASDLKQHLADNAELVCYHLLPEGKAQGNSFRASGVDGGKGQSLAVNLTGPSAGLFIDYANPTDKGSLLDLWSAARSLPYTDMLYEATRWLEETCGITTETLEPAISNLKKRDFTEPAKPDHIPLTEGCPVYDYLVHKRRIPPETLRLYHVQQSPCGRQAIYLHWTNSRTSNELGRNESSILCLQKHVWLKEHIPQDHSQYFTNPNPLHVLWGKEIVDPNDTGGVLTICEGHVDALSWSAIGIPAVSVPSGAGNSQWIENDWDYLQQFHTFYLSFDMDNAGQAGLEEAVLRLGRDQCRVIHLDYKDANETLCAGKTTHLKQAWKEASILHPTALVQASNFIEQVRQEAQKDHNWGHVALDPAFNFRIRPHEYTLWTGYLGQGKSTVIRQLCLALGAHENIMSCLALLEEGTAKYLLSMLKQWSGDQNIGASEYYTQAFETMSSNIICYDINDRVPLEKVLDSWKHAFKMWGVWNFALDNVMMLKINREDNEAHSIAANKIKQFVKDFPVHVHVVAHPRKPFTKDGEFPSPPMPHEVRGASEWGDLAHNIISVWRNLQKNADIWQEKNMGTDDLVIQSMIEKMPDGRLTVGKQRETGDLPVHEYWFDPLTKLIRPSYNSPNPILWTP